MRDTGGGIQVAVVKVAKLLIDNAPTTLTSGYKNTQDRGAGDVWVSLARYDDELVEEIEKRLRSEAPVEYKEDGITRKDDLFETPKWDDKKMVRSFARMGLAHGAKPEITKDTEGNIVTYDLVPVTTSDWVDLGTESEEEIPRPSPDPHTGQGIVLESSREFRVKLYMGTPPTNDSPRTKITLPRSEVDFPLGFGALLVDVELTMGWDLETLEEESPRATGGTDSRESEPETAGILGAAIGNVEALQAARD
ncbi:Telomerase protein component 1 [Serendipita sp. 399]|nr:Telomerase protein component 1 [Serendipita sp. 399]